MSEKQFTAADFKEMKKALGLTNKDVAEIIGTSETNVKNQTAPGKPLGTWAKSMVYVYQQMRTNP